MGIDAELLDTALAIAGEAVTRAADYELLPPVDNVTWINSTHGFIVATILLQPDEQYEKTETIALRLQPHPIFHQDCTLIGSLDITVTIRDGSPGIAQFARSSFTVSESEELATVVLQRFRGSTGRMQVRVEAAIEASSATPREDYKLNSATVTWEDGEDTPKSIVVPLLPDKCTRAPTNVWFS